MTQIPLNTLLIAVALVLNVALLAGLILWLPRLFRRQDGRASDEATRLREMLLDVLSEQEAVTLRQTQIGSSLMNMQTQIGKLAETPPQQLQISPESLAQAAGLPELDQRVEALQGQLGSLFERAVGEQREHQVRDSQSWTSLLGLLAAMQDRIASLTVAVEQPRIAVASDRLMQDLDNEMQNLRSLADEIAGFQWKLRRSVVERETSLAALRAQVNSNTRVDHRAA